MNTPQVMQSFPFTILTVCLTLTMLKPSVCAKEIFKDDFSAPELSKQWKLFKAESKVQNGVLIAAEPDGGDHNAVHSVGISPTADIDTELSFRFEGSKEFSFTLNDSKYKGSHAGHIARVTVNPKSVTIRDEKTGIFKNEIFEMKQKDAATTALLATKTKSFEVSLSPQTWYKLFIQCKGESIRVSIDDKEVGSFSAEGFAHPTKDKPALVVPGRFMHFDNVSISTP